MQIGIQNERSARERRKSPFSGLFRAFSAGRTETLPAYEAAREADDLVEAIKQARREWACAYSNFEYADDNEMVDYYTYKIKACQVRYNYLIRQAKEKGIKVELLETAGVAFYSESAQ